MRSDTATTAWSVTSTCADGLSVDVVLTGARLELRVTLLGGEIAAGAREAAIEAAFGRPGASRARVLRASIPAGDIEILDALRIRCAAVRTRSYGGTCLVDGVLGPQH